MDTRHIDLSINHQENEMKLFIFYIFLISATMYGINAASVAMLGTPNLIFFICSSLVYSFVLDLFTKFVLRRAGNIKMPSIIHYTSIFTIIGILFAELHRIYIQTNIEVELLEITIILICSCFTILNYLCIISNFNKYITNHSGE